MCHVLLAIVKRSVDETYVCMVIQPMAGATTTMTTSMIRCYLNKYSILYPAEGSQPEIGLDKRMKLYVLKRSCLAPVAIDCYWLVAECLLDEVRYHTSVT